MGAEQFFTSGYGADADAAFDAARDQALYDYGHRGYTGTIAEKDEFVIVSSDPTTYEAAHLEAQELLSVDDERVSDKWGPAGAIRYLGEIGETDGKPGEHWLFFGHASS